MLLVEALIGLGVISVVLLILVTTFSRSAVALTKNRIKSDISIYAQSELEQAQALAKLGALVGGVPTAIGYEQLDPNGPTNGLEQSVAYSRLTLLRTLNIREVEPGVKDITVRLRDTQMPERFSPLSMSAQVRRPDPEALDMRGATVASLNLALRDEDGAAISSECEPKVSISGIGTWPALDLPPPGNGLFRYLAAGAYSASFMASKCSPGYWPRTVSAIVLEAGVNSPADVNPMQLNRVKTAAAVIRVVNPDNIPVADAQVVLEAPTLPLSIPGYSGGREWTGSTDANGELARVDLPIPVEGDTTFDGWVVKRIMARGYFTASPNLPFTITHATPVTVGPITIHPIRTAPLGVMVRENANNAPIEAALVRVYDNGDENAACSSANLAGCAELVRGKTDANGFVSLSVPISFPADLTRTSRSVQVVVSRVPFRREIEVRTLDVGVASSLTARLVPATLTLALDPITSPNNPHIMATGGQFRPVARAIYDGYDGPIDLSLSSLPGAQDVDLKWAWAVAPLDLGVFSEGITTQPQGHFTAGSSPGSGVIRTDVAFRYTYPGGDFGPAIGPLTYNASGTYDVNVIASGPPVLAVTIAGPQPVTPASTTEHQAVVTYGTSSLPPDLVYSWTFVCPIGPRGTSVCNATFASATDQPTVSVTATGQRGAKIQLMVTVSSALIGETVTSIRTIRIGYPDVVASIPCGNPATELQPFEVREIPASVSGGSGNYTYDWALADPATHQRLGTRSSAGSLTVTGGAATSFQAAAIGSVDVQLIVSDSVSGDSTGPLYCRVTVVPPGASY